MTDTAKPQNEACSKASGLTPTSTVNSGRKLRVLICAMRSDIFCDITKNSSYPVHAGKLVDWAMLIGPLGYWTLNNRRWNSCYFDV